MREHYPKLVLDLTHSTDDVPEGKLDTYIHYARSRESRDDMDARTGGEDWACPMVRIGGSLHSAWLTLAVRLFKLFDEKQMQDLWRIPTW